MVARTRSWFDLRDRSRPPAVAHRVSVGFADVFPVAEVDLFEVEGEQPVTIVDAVIGCGAQVGAGALVPPRMSVPEGTLALGVPARIVRSLTDAELAAADAKPEAPAAARGGRS